VLEDEDLPVGEQLARLSKIHSSDAFYGCDEPLEAVVFSVFSEMQKELELIRAGDLVEHDVDR
jgi:hypothetical protein